MRREGKPQNDLLQKQPRLPLEGEGCVPARKSQIHSVAYSQGVCISCVCVCVCVYTYIHIILQHTFISQQPAKINQVEG